MDELKNFEAQATDLNKAMADRDKARAEQEAKDQAAMQAAAVAWDKGMRRMFKGIMAAPVRRSFVRAELARQERAES